MTSVLPSKLETTLEAGAALRLQVCPQNKQTGMTPVLA
jgi:hypothetical protein